MSVTDIAEHNSGCQYGTRHSTTAHISTGHVQLSAAQHLASHTPPAAPRRSASNTGLAAQCVASAPRIRNKAQRQTAMLTCTVDHDARARNLLRNRCQIRRPHSKRRWEDATIFSTASLSARSNGTMSETRRQHWASYGERKGGPGGHVVSASPIVRNLSSDLPAIAQLFPGSANCHISANQGEPVYSEIGCTWAAQLHGFVQICRNEFACESGRPV
eukprot:2944135-Rhodomonas_salina.1